MDRDKLMELALNDGESVWKDYTDAGHDLPSLLDADNFNKCARCGSAMIDLSEDLVYGTMRQCRALAGEW